MAIYITYGKVFGGTPNIYMFWLFPENGSISEWTVNKALIVHTTLQNSALTKKKNIYIYIFAKYQNYPLALKNLDPPILSPYTIMMETLLRWQLT